MATNESAMAIEESAGADGTNECVLVLEGLSDVLAQAVAMLVKDPHAACR